MQKRTPTLLLAIKVENTPAVAARLQVLADARALQFAGCQNNATPLARILFDFGDGAALLGTFERFVTFEQITVDVAGKLIAPGQCLLQLAFKLRASLNTGRVELRPRFFYDAHSLAL